MALDPAFLAVPVAGLVGVALSMPIDRLVRPRPVPGRPWQAWVLHAGLWLSIFSLGILLHGRTWFSCAGASVLWLMLVLVNNAKHRALREPFVWPDFEYFVDVLRHPRLYMPFLGWPKVLIGLFGLAVAVGFSLRVEAIPVARFVLSGQLGGVAATLAVGLALVAVGSRAKLEVTFDPERDVASLGLLASLWRYAQESRAPLAPAADADSDAFGEPIGCAHAPAQGSTRPSALRSGSALADASLPHLVAVQSESFFDARRLFSGIRPDVLAEFDRLKAGGWCHGRLTVPAWGANTVRSEFAFLTGLPESLLGPHRFNPYRRLARGWAVRSLAAVLKARGYRTVAIHPYPASFYLRNRVYPRLGFDEFLDIEAFVDAPRSGPYVADRAVAAKIDEVISSADGPVFVFAVTMENHGPLHLESVEASEPAQFYSEPPPPGCDDLTIYLRHLRNADRMMASLARTLKACNRRAELCWFGDHVPIMSRVYRSLGAPDGEVDYLLWGSRTGAGGGRHDAAIHDLARRWLQVAGLKDVACASGPEGADRRQPAQENGNSNGTSTIAITE